MCLAIPGKLVEWTCVDEVFGEAWVDFGGVRRRVAMACVPEAQLGDYVLVHAGVAISKVKSDDAEERLAIWQGSVDAMTDLESLADHDSGTRESHPLPQPKKRDGVGGTPSPSDHPGDRPGEGCAS